MIVGSRRPRKRLAQSLSRRADARLLACSRIIRLHPMLLNPLITNRKRRALGDECRRR